MLRLSLRLRQGGLDVPPLLAQRIEALSLTLFAGAQRCQFLGLLRYIFLQTATCTCDVLRLFCSVSWFCGGAVSSSAAWPAGWGRSARNAALGGGVGLGGGG
jgi:hypothetical protein